jgi:hypothetical protein
MVAGLVAEPDLAVKENGPMEEIVLAEDGRSRELWWWKKKSKCTWEEEKNLATIDVVVLTLIIFVPLSWPRGTVNREEFVIQEVWFVQEEVFRIPLVQEEEEVFFRLIQLQEEVLPQEELSRIKRLASSVLLLAYCWRANIL